MLRRTRIHSREYISTTGLLPSLIQFPDDSSYIPFVTPYRVFYNPNKQACWFSSVSLAATRESNFSLPPGTKMFQFSCLLTSYASHLSIHNITAGFPFGNLWINAYFHPKHIVVSNVLRRLLVPRHPPCALNNLIYVSTIRTSSALKLNLLLSCECSFEH